MFFKKIKQNTLVFLLTLFIIPYSASAYSNKILVGGDTIGIKLNTNGILVAGSYEINGHNSSIEAGIKNGDIIHEINNNKVYTVDEMVNIINNCNCDSLSINYERNNKNYNTKLNLYLDNGTYKTGLYVKDQISGVGTLTYIDPETKIFGVLGHEIVDTNTNNIVDIKDGTIFDSKITSITRSSNGDPGEKNAILYSDKVNGIIKENTNKGIFGNYTEDISNKKLYDVANIDDIKIGDAKILTVLDGNKINEYDIKITSVKNTKDKLKNIQFEIVDNELLEQTNGIIQGMSGSPIIQDNYIVGAVTHVVVEDPHKGYGILITNMLEEGEN